MLLPPANLLSFAADVASRDPAYTAPWLAVQAMLRPVSMMVPDFTLIAEIMMFSEGFSSAKVLAKKMIAIMELSQQQLSKQDHYDYGLR